MSAAIISAVFGSLILAVLGWMIQQMNRQFDRLSLRIDGLTARVDDLAQRVSRIEGRLDEREHHQP